MTIPLCLYQSLMRIGTPLCGGLLSWRERKGKEETARMAERTGIASRPRPHGPLVWIHAASVGEAQSAMILLDKLPQDMNILITSGTVNSARFLDKRLPARAIHHYIPLDVPHWVARFLDHWRPDLALWMESELWPNMLGAMRARKIPAILVNARLSDASYQRWRTLPASARQILSGFALVLAQTDDAALKYRTLGASPVHNTDNLKYSAAPLPVNEGDLAALQNAVAGRLVWVYASTHEGEEALAARVHDALKQRLPGLLTVIVPRHPERRGQIAHILPADGTLFRGEDKKLPDTHTQIYVADTLGELGLFYTAAPVALIGRSFSDDGGGGHNPIEAAQFDCAVLTGPHYQHQRALFDKMRVQDAAIIVGDEAQLSQTLYGLLSDPAYLARQQDKARRFAAAKEAVVDTVMDHLRPFLPTAAA